MKLNGKQKANCRKIAQTIKPTFQIGNQELHSKLLIAIDESFNNRELIKIKINRADKSDKEIVSQIATKISTNIPKIQVVGVIGTTIILFKRNKNPELWLKI